MEKRALVLLSGGLDSTLALKLMLEQGIDVVCIKFFTPFCKCKFCITRFTSGIFNVPVKVIPLGEDYLEIVKKPKYGYGANMNPCIDCRIFMFKNAKDYMKEYNAYFIVTGEVLDQRPMSQRKEQLKIIEIESGLEGLILRPLSAKLLPMTIPEREKVVDREKLLSIRGRSRKQQIDLAYRFGIFDFPLPSGGCLLTDPNFSNRLRDLLKYSYNNITLDEIEILKVGRHFRLSRDTKLIIPRDEYENMKLINLISSDDLMIEYAKDEIYGFLLGKSDENLQRLAVAIYLKYIGKKSGLHKVKLLRKDGQEYAEVMEKALTGVEIDRYRIN